MKINCMACGHQIDIGDAYDNYEGPFRCWVCGTLMMVKTHEGDLKKMGINGKWGAPVYAEVDLEEAGG